MPLNLHFALDGSGWVLDEEVKAMASALEHRGIKSTLSSQVEGLRNAHILFPSSYHALQKIACIHPSNRTFAIYMHGIDEEPEFRIRFDMLKKCHPLLDGVMVTHRAFRDRLLSSGINPVKVHVIPLGIDLGLFTHCTPDARQRARRTFGLPQDAIVVGSFQKDGVGWEEGLEPKWIKGPDLLVKSLAHLQASHSRLHVLLTGPSRGYVTTGLKKAGIPYTHHKLSSISEMPHAYHALDLYLVTSRIEGGPKPALEAIASGIPLVSTPVGQVPDMLAHGLPLSLSQTWNPADLATLCHEALQSTPSQLIHDTIRARLEAYSYLTLSASYLRMFQGLAQTPSDTSPPHSQSTISPAP